MIRIPTGPKIRVAPGALTGFGPRFGDVRISSKKDDSQTRGHPRYWSAWAEWRNCSNSTGKGSTCSAGSCLWGVPPVPGIILAALDKQHYVLSARSGWCGGSERCGRGVRVPGTADGRGRDGRCAAARCGVWHRRRRLGDRRADRARGHFAGRYSRCCLWDGNVSDDPGDPEPAGVSGRAATPRRMECRSRMTPRRLARRGRRSRSRIRHGLSEGWHLAKIAYRDPEHVAESIALNSTHSLGEPSLEWAQRVRKERDGCAAGGYRRAIADG